MLYFDNSFSLYTYSVESAIQDFINSPDYLLEDENYVSSILSEHGLLPLPNSIWEYIQQKVYSSR